METQNTRTRSGEQRIDRLLDKCERLFVAYSTTPKWKFIRRYNAQNRWLLAVAELEHEQRKFYEQRRVA
jgi:hypothetical protein